MLEVVSELIGCEILLLEKQLSCIRPSYLCLQDMYWLIWQFSVVHWALPRTIEFTTHNDLSRLE